MLRNGFILNTIDKSIAPFKVSWYLNRYVHTTHLSAPSFCQPHRPLISTLNPYTKEEKHRLLKGVLARLCRQCSPTNTSCTPEKSTQNHRVVANVYEQEITSSLRCKTCPAHQSS
jgi:hypothetical protein